MAYRESRMNGDEKSSAAGILFLTPSGEGLFLKRGGPGTTKHIGEWDLPGGGMEQGERPEDSARRETLEEIGKLPAWHLAPLDRKTSEDGIDYTTFAQIVPQTFDPHLNTNEHTEYQWAPLSSPPQPLHKGLRRLLAKEPEEEIEERAAKVPPESPESIAAHDAEWHEEDHPRRDDGKFGSGGGGKKEERSSKSKGGEVQTLYRAGGPQGRYADKGEATFFSLSPKGAAAYGDPGEYNVRVPSDTFDAKGKDWKLYQQFLEETGSAAGRGRNGLPFWTAEQELREWLDKKGVKYSAIKFDENTGIPSIAIYGQVEHANPVSGDEASESIAAHDEALAFDRESVRREDMDGRLHVAISNISKANVCPYRGSEIPNCEELGLDANKVYQLLRDPEELARAAPTFNNIQVLRRHIPVSAEDHRPYDVVGTTGSEANFEYPYLRNSLSIWEASAIDAVEKEEKRELSCGYHYVADMTPGVFEGKKYDGVMREIVGNHVALVKDGRAGPDVLVGDEAMKDDDILPEGVRRAKVHADESLGIAEDREMATKFAEKKAEILKEIEKATKGKLAKDANLSHVTELLDHLEHPSSDESTSGPQHRAMEAAAHGTSTLDIPKGVGEEYSEADKGKTFHDQSEHLGGFLRDCGMDEENIKKACDMAFGSKPATDAFKEGEGGSEKEHEEDEEEGEKEVEKLDKEGKDAMPERKKVSSPGALDAALKAAVETTAKRVKEEVRTSERKRQMALDEIRPYVGELSSDVAMGLDSASQVYRHALKMLGVQNLDEIHKSALPTILRLHKKAGAREAQRIAEDAAAAADSSDGNSFYEMFPGAERLRAV